jgi:putative chitinase
MNLIPAIGAVAPTLSTVEINLWSSALLPALIARQINTPKRLAAFLGQVAAETGGLTELEEDLDYSATGLRSVWPEHFPSIAIATSYARDPERTANRAYAGRMGNGNEASGDGWRFRGRGVTQTTGRDAYTRLATDLGRTLDDDMLAWMLTPDGAAAAGCWDWWQLGCSALADAWSLTAVTERINGGETALAQRVTASNAALRALTSFAAPPQAPKPAPPPAPPAVVADTDEADELDSLFNPTE